jgi:hypothetical protein
MSYREPVVQKNSTHPTAHKLKTALVDVGLWALSHNDAALVLVITSLIQKRGSHE